MRLLRYIPFLIFLSVITFLSYKSFYNQDSTSFYRPQDLSVDLSNTSSLITKRKIILSDGIYILHVFSSWCSVCRQDHQTLLKFAASNNIKIIGLIWKDSEENIMKILKEEGNPYYDLAMLDDLAILNLGVSGIPETFIVDKNSKILLKLIGALQGRTLEHAIYTASK